MTLGRSTSGAIKIKTDGEGGGLRAVSCSCCEEEERCCMYAADALVDNATRVAFGLPGGLVAEDFPEKIIYNGIEATRSIYSTSGSMGQGIRTPQYFSHGHPPSLAGSTTRSIRNTLNSFYGGWIIVDGLGRGQRSEDRCLIAPFGILQPHEILDVFADTYTVAGVQIVRQSLCRWTGNDGGQKILLRYWDGSEDSAPSGANQIGWWLTVGEQGNANRKTGYQSSPRGSYGEFTVS